MTNNRGQKTEVLWYLSVYFRSKEALLHDWSAEGCDGFVMLLPFVRQWGGIGVMTDDDRPLLTLQMDCHAQLDANADTKGQDRTHRRALEQIQLHVHLSRMHLEETYDTHNNKNKNTVKLHNSKCIILHYPFLHMLSRCVQAHDSSVC